MTMSVYITGDLHGTKYIEKLLPDRLKGLKKNDIIIICGDFGFIYNKALMKRQNKYLNFLTQLATICFIDGSYDNLKEINCYPEISFHGGLANVIQHNVMYLKRGQVYDFEGNTFFCMGGGMSIDKNTRVKGVSWWKEEEIHSKDIVAAAENMKIHNNKVDYVITYTCPSDIAYRIAVSSEEQRRLEDPSISALQSIYDNIEFKKWFFGCWHKDESIDADMQAIFEKVEKII